LIFIEHKTNVYAIVTMDKNFNIYVVQKEQKTRKIKEKHYNTTYVLCLLCGFAECSNLAYAEFSQKLAPWVQRS